MSKFAAALTLAACATLVPQPGRSAEKPKPQPAERTNASAQKMTVSDIRNVGTALFSWLTDQVTDDEPAGKKGDDPGACPPTGTSKATEMQIDDIPLISWEDLNAILVPQYIHELPREDGWGNAYEFRLNRENLLCKTVMAIRSGGADGSFSTELYEVAGFTPNDVDQDLVWADGFFVRWPDVNRATKTPEKK